MIRTIISFVNENIQARKSVDASYLENSEQADT